MKPVPVLVGTRELKVELEQLRDEGRDVTRLEPEFRRLLRRDLGKPAAQLAAQDLFAAIPKLPAARGYEFVEPSDLAGIRKQRPRAPKTPQFRMTDRALLDRLHGAWLGRCAGCLLGKPVEGIRSHQLWPYLKATRQYPLGGYISPKAPKKTFERCGIDDSRRQRLNIPFTAGCMPEDDDTNYTIVGLALLKNHGRDFTPQHVGDFWLRNIPYYHVCTAERVAYRNLSMGLAPPASAVTWNPYREWIGAQIRADFFGYVAAGNPALAAEFAWRDASISHVRNGVYGEMWVAAMLAAAPMLDDPAAVIKAGLAQVPRRCRLARQIERVAACRRAGLSAAEMEADIHQRWDEANPHHWCHTISNAEIVAMALLWGELDFGRTVSIAVQACFDTDCNGATAGSVAGMMLGAKRLPARWIGPLHDTLETGVAGYYRVRVSDLAGQTLDLRRKTLR